MDEAELMVHGLAHELVELERGVIKFGLAALLGDVEFVVGRVGIDGQLLLLEMLQRLRHGLRDRRLAIELHHHRPSLAIPAEEYQAPTICLP